MLAGPRRADRLRRASCCSSACIVAGPIIAVDRRQGLAPARSARSGSRASSRPTTPPATPAHGHDRQRPAHRRVPRDPRDRRRRPASRTSPSPRSTKLVERRLHRRRATAAPSTTSWSPTSRRRRRGGGRAVPAGVGVVADRRRRSHPVGTVDRRLRATGEAARTSRSRTGRSTISAPDTIAVVEHRQVRRRRSAATVTVANSGRPERRPAGGRRA